MESYLLLDRNLLKYDFMLDCLTAGGKIETTTWQSAIKQEY